MRRRRSSRPTRARELCDRVDESRHLFPVSLAVGWFYLQRGPSDVTRELGMHLATMAETTGDRATLLAAHTGLGPVALHRGEFEAALDHAERGIALYDSTA